MKVEDNDPCPCGSGKDYKKCCMQKQQSTELPKVANQHIIDEDAQRIFQTYFNKRNGFLARKLPEDYGIDYIVELIDDQGQTSGISFYVQLKGTEKIKLKKNFIALSFKKSTLNLYSRHLYPTFIIIIDVINKQGYWHNSFDLIDELDQRNPYWRNKPEKTVTIYIPLKQDFSISELIKLKQYVGSVHTRRNAIPQGPLVLMQPFDSARDFLNIEDLSKLINSCDYDKFFKVVSGNPFYYLSDINFSKLFNLFEQIPPKKIHKHPDIMAIYGISAQKKGYYQEAKKWLQLAINEKFTDTQIRAYAELLLSEIKFMYGHISEKEFSDLLYKIKEKAPKEIKSAISFRQFTLSYFQKEKEVRKYGRFRQIDLLKDSITQLWNFIESCDDSIKEFVLLTILQNYIVLVPSLWGEISARIGLRKMASLYLTLEEIKKMEDDAVEASKEAQRIFNILTGESKNIRISLEIKAEGFLSYSMLIYHLQTVKMYPLLFLKEHVDIPEKIPLSATERSKIEQALKYCIEAKNLFKKIGSKHRETTALIYIMGYYEDLGEAAKYEDTKIEVEKMLEITWVPNNIDLFKMSINEGSFRKRVFNNLRKKQQQNKDFDNANMSQADIEGQVECNCKTFNITDKKRIENVRKDVISYVLAAKFRINFCKHFQLFQDMRHSYNLETLYTIDPNRKGVCKLLKHESQIIHNNPEIIINSFKKTYCEKCKFREPLKKEGEH
jgi:hypothetical protein